ncbi:MAG: formyltransferase family protein [Pontixanthobacter sp.]
MTAEIVLIGKGHGAHAALHGLRLAFTNIDVVTDDPELIDMLQDNEAVKTFLDDSDAPIGVMAGSPEILSAEVLDKRPIFNVHYALLPRYRGYHPVVWAMLNDEAEVGLTVHRADPDIDHGPVLYQYALPITETTTSRDLMLGLNDHVAQTLGPVLRKFCDGSLETRKQDEGSAIWVPKRNRDDCLIDFDEPHRFLSLFFRALVEPYPLPALICRRGRFEVLQHRLISRDYRAHNGRVVNVSGDDAYIKTADGLLVVSELRDENGKSVPAGSILKIGARLQ